jgi:hypothetical protein
MPKKSKKSRYNNNNCIKSDDGEQEQEPYPIYFKSKYNKVQALNIQQLTQDFLKNNIIEFDYYK